MPATEWEQQVGLRISDLFSVALGTISYQGGLDNLGTLSYLQPNATPRLFWKAKP
jgi:hypothetical protein